MIQTQKPNVSNYATIGSIRSIWIPSWQHILTFFHFIYIPYPSLYRLVQKELKWEITIIPKPGLRDFRRDSLTVTTMRGDQPVVWSPSKNHAFGRKRKHKTSLHSREIAVASPMTLSCRRNSWVEKQASLLDKTKIRGAIKQVNTSTNLSRFNIQVTFFIYNLSINLPSKIETLANQLHHRPPHRVEKVILAFKAIGSSLLETAPGNIETWTFFDKRGFGVV